ncbi:MAG TPA: hypothetical protein VLA19_15470 [Herpetosiphonaceae bacterium]|nr:hypothetical protein [Herpetosiphonaceae bacterium]
MARRKGFLHTLAKASRDFDRQQKAQQRAATQAARAAERARAAYERSTAQATKQALQEQKRLYLEARMAEVALQNEELEETIEQLNNLLGATLGVDDFFDLQRLKKQPELPLFDTSVFGPEGTRPSLASYEVPEPTGLKRLLPGTKDKHAQAVAEAQARYEKDLASFNRREAERQAQIDEARGVHDQRVVKIRAEVDAENAEIDQFQRDLEAGSADAVVNYCSLVLEASVYPEDFPQHAKVAYVPESKQLVVEYDLPPFSVVPEAAVFKYQKAKDEITTTARPLTQRKALYASVIAQVTLRTIHELFEADHLGQLETIVFNGFVDSIDPGLVADLGGLLLYQHTSWEGVGVECVGMSPHNSAKLPLACVVWGM